METAKKFWESREEYPPVTCNYQRRYLDLGMILEHVEGVDSVLDLGCGEGQNLLMLRELTSISEYYAYDLSEVFINNLVIRWGNCDGLVVQVKDFISAELPKVDLCICMGAMLYVLDDDKLTRMLSNIKANKFICRVPCELGNRVTIDRFSPEFKADYAAVYRTIPEYISILSDFFVIKNINRCYPDSLESEYGSKQYLFVCEVKK